MTEIRESSSFLLGISMKDALFLDAQVIQGGGGGADRRFFSWFEIDM